MIDIRTATLNATRHLQGLAPLMGGNIQDIRLEEAELSEDERFWLITLGFNVPDQKALTPSPFDKRRDYKQFKVDISNGDIKAMKIRSV